jgi:non-heme chloroperoxidase
VYGYAHHCLTPREDLVDDVVQQMSLAALSGLAGFLGQSSLRAWVIGIARHKVEDVYRRLLRAPDAAVFTDLRGLDDASPPRRLIRSYSAGAAHARCREFARGVASDPMRSTLFVVALAVVGASVLAPHLGLKAGSAWRDPSPHQVRWITVDSSVRLEVLDWGGSVRPIVLLGCYLTAHVYDQFAPKLTDQFHVYGITRRGIGASDKPTSGYTVQRSAEDVLAVLDSLKLQKSFLLGTSCAGQILTMFASEHSDRLMGLVYLDGATDPTLTAQFEAAMPDPATLPRSVKPPPAPDYRSFEAYRIAQRRDVGVAFPEAELRQDFVANSDGSVGRSLLSPVIRRAITVDARVKPDYAGIRVPVLAIYGVDPPFEEVAVGYLIRNEQERAALRQQYDVTRAMYTRWEQQLLAGVPNVRIVELPGANLYMFLSNQADVLREVRGFAAAVTAGR